MDGEILREVCASDEFRVECILGNLIHNIQLDDFQPPTSTKSFCEVIEKYVYLYILPFGKVEKTIKPYRGIHFVY